MTLERNISFDYLPYFKTENCQIHIGKRKGHIGTAKKIFQNQKSSLHSISLTLNQCNDSLPLYFFLNANIHSDKTF